MDLQELISRGRFIFVRAPQRLAIYKLIDGKTTAHEIAKRTKRHINNVHRDIRALADLELIEGKKKEGKTLQKDGFAIFQKTPLARTIPISYFSALNKAAVKQSRSRATASTRAKSKRPKQLALPTETEILDFCKAGEDQAVEFKAAGTDVRKISREIAAMLNTRQGGVVIYGVDDDGTIQGSDVTRQALDQPLQNSVKNSIAPAAVITLKSVSVLGAQVLVVIAPPWNRKDVYQFDERVLIRKGTNVFAAKPEELRKLHKGEYVV